MAAAAGHARSATFRVPISLREASGPAHFLPNFEIRHAAGFVEPIEYEGRSYAFSHAAPVDGYVPTASDRLYVFVEASQRT